MKPDTMKAIIYVLALALLGFIFNDIRGIKESREERKEQEYEIEERIENAWQSGFDEGYKHGEYETIEYTYKGMSYAEIYVDGYNAAKDYYDIE